MTPLPIFNMDDTIIAPATVNGHSAIGILRLSGKGTLTVLQRFCRARRKNTQYIDFAARPRQMLYCVFHANFNNIRPDDVDNAIDDDNRDNGETVSATIIDSGLCVYYQQPYSYTGEDAAELFLHGNPLLLRQMLSAIAGSGLARLAQPGEFSQRAYLNRKLDLSQAQAVNQIIAARSSWELKAAQRNLEGRLAKLSGKLRHNVLQIKVQLEAQIDFSSEDDSIPLFQTQFDQIKELELQITRVLEMAAASQKLRSGFQVVICGIPNAGKSSLFNCILGWDRSIVAEQAGTTRDYISEEIQLADCAVRFIDTAGLRELSEQADNIHNSVEKAGIQMSRELIAQSDLILYVIDGARAPYALPSDLQESFGGDPLNSAVTGAAIVPVVNKCETTNAQKYLRTTAVKPLCISCHQNIGLDELRQAIREHLLGKLETQHTLLLEVTQQQHLEQARQALQRIFQLTEEQEAAPPLEIIALELDQCAHEIGAITSPIDNEEILGHIFANFCIGK